VSVSDRLSAFLALLSIATAEDTLLAKLEWARLGHSDLQIRDIVGIMEVQNSVLDRAYIEIWLDYLEVRELWERMLAQTDSQGLQ
jgi:hypothetical protein